ncbi:TPA: hypothetical protein DEP21_01290 [Patescibacteria group bacterium]|nr:hypothetical protein [Candidatus Gracilibacteria bacterium]
MDSIVMTNICKIMQIYNIPSATCNSTDDDTIKAVPDNLTPENGTTTSSSSTNWLKIVFIVL